MFFGFTNSGKSYGAIKIAGELKKMFLEELKNDSRLFLSFDDDEYQKKLRDMKEKDIMIRDETPNMSGEGTRTLEKSLKNVMNITRAGQYCFIFVSPDEYAIKSNAVSYFLESAGINKEKEKARFILYNEKMIPLGRIFIKKPHDEEFIKFYEIEKKKNIKRMIDNAGLTTMESDLEKIKMHVSGLMEFCLERKAITKGEIRSSITYYNGINLKNQIKGIKSFIDDVVNNTFIEMKNSKLEKNMNDEIYVKQSDFFELDRNFMIEDYKFDINIEKMLSKEEKDIYELYIEKKNTQTEIAEIKKITQGRVSQIITKAGKMFYTLGHDFENDFSVYLKKIFPNKEVHCDGLPGHPDIYMIDKENDELIVISCKCLNHKTRKNINKNEFDGETTYAKKNIGSYSKINMYVAICSGETGKVHVEWWDPMNPRSISMSKSY
jgi:hypothetical protein